MAMKYGLRAGTTSGELTFQAALKSANIETGYLWLPHFSDAVSVHGCTIHSSLQENLLSTLLPWD